MRFVYDDGGRKAAGFKGEAGDCVTRAIAIAMDAEYMDIYKSLGYMLKTSKHVSPGKRTRTPRDGYPNKLAGQYVTEQGWKWMPTMGIGSGCKVHLRAEELPKGRLIVRLSRHWAAVIDGVLHDTHDCSRGGTRCVYGYWRQP